MKFYVCKTCGNFVEMVKDAGVPMVCCGQPMQELIPGTSDGAAEKHVPVYSIDGDKVVVNVGEVAHPMAEVHYIEWIAIETVNGVQRTFLKPGDKPETVFTIPAGDSFVAAYAYCNLHGLWKAE